MSDTITQIGRYEISRQMVDTALASVYDAFDPVERKPVAIRVPRTTQIREAEKLSGLKHPGLMTVLSCEENKGEPFLVLEPFDGAPLDTRIAVGQKMEPAAAMGLLRQIASTLDYAHAHGTIHGSLHPSSILLNDRDEIKVLDLGPINEAGSNAAAGQLLHAVHFLSPECIRDLPLDGRSDQFSLAVLAHLLLTGELPFPGTPLGVMFRIAYQGLERDAIRHLPPGAQSALQRALAKSPMERYPACGALMDALEGSLIRKPVAATRLADASQFVPPRREVQAADAASRSGSKRHFSREALKYFGITFVVCVLLLGAIFYFVLPKSSAPAPQVSPATPAVSQPAAPAAAPAPAQAHRVEASPPAKSKEKPRSKAARRKAEPEVVLKPVEPKIIRP